MSENTTETQTETPTMDKVSEDVLFSVSEEQYQNLLDENSKLAKVITDLETTFETYLEDINQRINNCANNFEKLELFAQETDPDNWKFVNDKSQE